MAGSQIDVGDLTPGNKSYGQSITGGPSGTFGPLPADITKAISNVISFLTVIAGLAFIVYFIIGAINWITSGGDPNKVKTAQLMITQALIGLTIVIIAYPTIIVVSQLLGIDSSLTNPLNLFNYLKFF